MPSLKKKDNKVLRFISLPRPKATLLTQKLTRRARFIGSLEEARKIIRQKKGKKGFKARAITSR